LFVVVQLLISLLKRKRYLLHWQVWSGHAVAHLIETLRYKPEYRGFIPDGVMGIFH
jgi:hypothetical protein